MSNAEVKMPPEAFEAFRGLPQEFIVGAVELSGQLPHDAEVKITTSNHHGQRRVSFVFTYGLWTFRGFVKPKSGEVVLKDVHWGGGQ